MPELDDRRTIYVMSHWLEVSSKGLFKEVLETQVKEMGNGLSEGFGFGLS